MIIYHIDNGLLQAEGPQYRWLYQIADCLSAVQICVPTATDAEDRTVYFLHCELCSWCIHIDSGQLILEISDHSMCQKYIQSLYNAITN